MYKISAKPRNNSTSIFAPFDIYWIDDIFDIERDCLVKGGRSPTVTRQSLAVDFHHQPILHD